MPFPMPWKWIAAGAAALAIIAAAFFAIKAYGGARYDAGVSDTDAKWQAAAEELKRRSARAAVRATDAAEAREAAYAARSAGEKERLDEAIKSGQDPFDVLFPAAPARGVQHDARGGSPSP